MKLIAGTTKPSATSISGLSLLLLHILSILQIPAQTDANVLSPKVLPNCDGCHCITNGTSCPGLPTISESMIPTFRAMTHVNSIDILCNPFLSLQCISPRLEQGEACAVELIPGPSGASCPNDYSYRLRTVPSLANATEGQYITHTGACGACSSLQDLALMMEYPDLPYKSQQCFFRSTAAKFIDTAVECYEEIGFTRSCAHVLSYHQRRIVDKDCGYQCAAWSFDGDIGRPSCDDGSGCGECNDSRGITARLELVAGRTFANSGYPSQKAPQCSALAPLSVIGGNDICSEAPIAEDSTDVLFGSEEPSGSPVQLPTEAPISVSDAPTEIPPTVDVSGSPTASPPTVDVSGSPTANPVTDPPSVAPVPSLTFQQCLSTAAIEFRTNLLFGGIGVFCDCSDAENGVSNLPKCYSSPDREASSQCSLGGTDCTAGGECCSTQCDRRNKCDRGSSLQRESRNNLRISAGLGGAAGGAQRGPRGTGQ